MPDTYLNRDLSFIYRLPKNEFRCFYHPGMFPELSAKDEGCSGPMPLFALLLKKLNKKATFHSVHHVDEFEQALKDFSANAKFEELYFNFSLKSTPVHLHASMIYVKKMDNQSVRVFFKNSFGNKAGGKGDFVENFPEFVNLFKKIFKNVDFNSDKSQQQSYDNNSCAIINYFNMVDHALSRKYRIPAVDSSGRTSLKVSQYRGLVAKDYKDFLIFQEKAKELTEKASAEHFPELIALRNKINAEYYGKQIPENLLTPLLSLFEFQIKHYTSEMDKFSFYSLSSEKKYICALKEEKSHQSVSKKGHQDQKLSYSKVLLFVSLLFTAFFYLPFIYSMVILSGFLFACAFKLLGKGKPSDVTLNDLPQKTPVEPIIVESQNNVKLLNQFNKMQSNNKQLTASNSVAISTRRVQHRDGL
jgi:hypothetical protein